MNKVRCADCQNFQEVFKFENGKKKLVWYGYCAAKSVYPAKEPDARPFPPDVPRAAPDEHAKMVIVPNGNVRGPGIVPDCLQAIKKA